VHDLRRRVVEIVGAGKSTVPLAVNLVSFGFRHGVPSEADLVFDVRFLPNPHFVAQLRPLSGLAAPARNFVMRAPAAKRFLRLTSALLAFLLPQYVVEGKTYVTIAIGCTGGRHRSVAIAEALARRVRTVKGVEVRVRHRDIQETV
jgi:RNase adapter protein RapZ